jgi:hypothetical protein
VSAEIVTVERDVERAGRYVMTVDVANRLRNPPGQRDAAPPDAHEGQLFDAAVALEDLVRDARKRPAHAVRIHHDSHAELPGGIG